MFNIDCFMHLIATLATAAMLCGCCSDAGSNNRTLPVPADVRRYTRTIDNNPDILHGEVTPSGSRLIDIGQPALEETLSLMSSASEATRLRAAFVIYEITRRMYGKDPRLGWVSKEDEIAWRQRVVSLGDLAYDAPSGTIARRLDAWRKWIRAGCPR
jgi:hypothetical protein